MKHIGKFRISGLLGKGGMGKVFKVEYPVTGKIGALKLLAPEPLLITLMGEKAVEDLFVTEAVTMASIRHPHVVEILDFDRFDGRPYYIMEFYCNDLGTLMGESYITERPSRIIGLEKTIRYIGQLLEGLACLHHNSVIHRDIKPFNILIDDLDNVKICDFGLSKLRNETFRGHKSLKVGTPYYAPPEQEQDPDSVDETADLYSVGVMLFRMLTGRLPEEKLLASSLNPDLDTAWDDFFHKALASRPDRRYGDTDAMAADLQQLASAWALKKESICTAPLEWLDEPDSQETVSRIRHNPIKVYQSQARDRFGLDELMHPRRLLTNRFEPWSDALLLDRTTRLIWERSGTRFPVNWKEAKARVRHLNQDKYQGLEGWRIPTVDELLTILTPPPRGMGHCLEPVFDARQHWLWSADRASFIAAWYASLELGFVASGDFSSFYHLKAVCTAPADLAPPAAEG